MRHAYLMYALFFVLGGFFFAPIKQFALNLTSGRV
jgi:hypothetical protein